MRLKHYGSVKTLKLSEIKFLKHVEPSQTPKVESYEIRKSSIKINSLATNQQPREPIKPKFLLNDNQPKPTWLPSGTIKHRSHAASSHGPELKKLLR